MKRMQAPAKRTLIKIIFAVAIIATGLFFTQQKAPQMPNSTPTPSSNIITVNTKGGLTAWLVKSPSIPMISVEIGFRTGAVFVPENQQGLAQLTAYLLDEGAADMNAQAFQEALDDIGANLNASAGRLDFNISLTTLSEEKTAAFALLKTALNQPRFDVDAIERVRASMLAGLKRQEESAGAISSREYRKILFKGHPYALAPEGTLETLPTLTQADIQAFYTNQITRKNMVISVVGDITPEELAPLLDEALLSLPAGETRNALVQKPAPIQASETIIEKNIPQADVIFGHLGIDRTHPQYFAATVLNHILGGGALTSRLGQEVREKRGLAYSVYSYFLPLPHQGNFTARVQTSNKTVREAIDLMKAEMRRIQTEPVDAEEFENAISYLTGSFPLRLDSNDKILGYLSVMQQENLGMDYLDTWPEKVKNITIADVQQAAQNLLNPDEVVTVIVGKPE